MKTSNKLLAGFFGLTLLGMIIFNFSMTKEIKNTLNPNSHTTIQPSSDTVLIDMDSIELNKTMRKQ